MEQEKVNEILVKYEKLKEILSQEYNSVRKLKKDIWKVMLDISNKASALVNLSGAQAENI